MKKYFVLWSGGLDSTYLVQKLLNDGHQVTAGYIEILNNVNQSERELKAVKEMAKIFSKKHGTRFVFKDVLLKFELTTYGGNMQLQQAPVWINVLSCVPPDTDHVAIGYVMNDCAISYLEDFHMIFRAYTGLMNKPITVEFPLTKMDKYTMWHALDTEYKYLIQWCEDPEYVKCGRCTSCKRMMDVGILSAHDTHFAKPVTYDPYLKKSDPWIAPLTVNLELDFLSPISTIGPIKEVA
jgi:7-cyano-7-deazaguanine synthase in queuosine biosynthesis